MLASATFLFARIHYPEWVTAGATVVLAVGVAAAFLVYWDARKTRHGQLVGDLSRRWDEELMAESILLMPIHRPAGIVALTERLYTPPVDLKDLDLYFKLQRFPTMIEAIGVLHSEGAISTRVVYKMWGPVIVDAWNVWGDAVATARERGNYRRAFKYFERLALIMGAELAKEKARDAKKAAKDAHKAAETARD